MELSQALHRDLSVDSISAQVSVSLNSDGSFAKWTKKSVADNSLQASPSASNPQKLILNTSGSFHGHDCLQIGCDIFRLGHGDLHAFPPRKLRKLLTTFSDGVHVFSCVEKVNMPMCADLDWPLIGFDSVHHPFLGKKRPWQLCRLGHAVDEPADANSGFFGGKNLSQMLGKSDVLHHEDHLCMHSWGSGGSFFGGGNGEGGGGGHGDDSGGLQQPEFEGGDVPIMMNWHRSSEKHEGRASQGKAGIGDMDIRESLFADEDGTISRNETDVIDDEDINTEVCSLHSASRHTLYGILKDLDRVLSSFLPDFKRPIHQDYLNFLWQYNAHQSAGTTAQAHDLTELHDELQDIELELGDDNFASEMEGNSNNLLEKLRRLTLGLAKHSTMVKAQGTRVQTLKSEEAIDVNARELMAFTTPKEGQSRSTFKGEERPTTISGQLQGVVDWLDCLAHRAPVNHDVNHERLENQLDDQKLRTLVNEAVATAVKQLSDADGAPAPTRQADMEALKRLQREVFSELLNLREKLDKVASARNPHSARHFSGTGKTNLQGEVKAGMAFVMLEDSSSRHSRGSLEQAGMQTGVDVKLTFETPFREKDLLITECIAGQGSSVGEGRALGGPMSLEKVQYLAHINDDISISFVPMGARGMDVTDIVNPMQDQGLTAFSSRGPALFDHCKGSAIGASWAGSSFALSAAHYLSGWGNQPLSLGTESGPLCLSTLGQLLLQPTERLVFSLSGLNRFWPSPPLPSSMGLHWSEMGPLVIPKIHSLQTSRSTLSSEDSFLSHCNSMSSQWGMLASEYHLDDPPESKGTSQLSIAVATEMELSENLRLGAWAQADDVRQDIEKGNFQWAVNLAKMSKNGVSCGASIGSSKPDFWSISTSEQEIYPGYVGGVGDAYGPQLHLEAFVRLNCGKGFTLQPGLLYLLNKHSRTPAFIVRSNWLF
ncbi:hypothetical protein GOP47_0016536 [Adiantum capillus-veneris]|uniref:Uncharacterized protein n=1 Tax=Adiantum capillus-veneris TaxID=13818 RepID=A0A9D4UIV8_ADICA|nr:hypothetical protein GOP47_0016536 [Adiantum capillus-veneris]